MGSETTRGQLTIVDDGDISIEISPSVIFVDVFVRYTTSQVNSQQIVQNLTIAQHHHYQEVNVIFKDAYGAIIRDTSDFIITDNLGHNFENNKFLYKWNYGDIVNSGLITITATNQITQQTATASLMVIWQAKQQYQLEEKTIFLCMPYNSNAYYTNQTTLPNYPYYYYYDKDRSERLVDSNHAVIDYISDNMVWTKGNNNTRVWYWAESLSEIVTYINNISIPVKANTPQTVYPITDFWITSAHVLRQTNDKTGIKAEYSSISISQWWKKDGVNKFQLLSANKIIAEKTVYLYCIGSYEKAYNQNYYTNIITTSIPSSLQLIYDVANENILQNSTLIHNTVSTDHTNSSWHLIESEHQNDQSVAASIDETMYPWKRKPMCIISKSVLISAEDSFITLPTDQNSRHWSSPIDTMFLSTPVYINKAPITNLFTTGKDTYTLSLTDITGQYTIPPMIVPEDSSELNNCAHAVYNNILALTEPNYALYDLFWKFSEPTQQNALANNLTNSRLVTLQAYRLQQEGQTSTNNSQNNAEVISNSNLHGTYLIYDNIKYELIAPSSTGTIYTIALEKENQDTTERVPDYAQQTQEYDFVLPEYPDTDPNVQEIETTFTDTDEAGYELKNEGYFIVPSKLNGHIKVIQLYYEGTTAPASISNDFTYQFDIDYIFDLPTEWSRNPITPSGNNAVYIVEVAILSENNITTIRASQWTQPTIYDASYQSKTIYLYKSADLNNYSTPTGSIRYFNNLRQRLDEKLLVSQSANGWQLYVTKQTDTYNIIAAQIVLLPENDAIPSSGAATITGTEISQNRWSDMISIAPITTNTRLIANNRNIVSIDEQYFLSSSPSLLIGDGEWSTDPPVWSAGRYYWTRNKINWDDNTFSYTSPKLAINNDSFNAAMNYIESMKTEINKIFRQSTRPVSSYNIGDLWYCTRPNSKEVIEYICISKTEGAPMSDWVLFNRVIADTIMNVDTKSGSIDILAGTNLNLSANRVLTASGNDKIVLGSDGNAELYAGNRIQMISGAIDGHLSTFTLDKTGINLTGQNATLLTTVNTTIATNGNIQIKSDFTTDSYIQLGTDEDPNKLILAPSGIESISGEFKRLTVNGRQVLTEDWLTHPIIVSPTKPMQSNVIWIQPEDSYGLFSDVGINQIIVKTQNPGTSEYLTNYYTDKDHHSKSFYVYEEEQLQGTGRIGFLQPSPGDSGSLINYPYDEQWKTWANSQCAWVHEHQLGMQWEQVGIQQWTDATIIAGINLTDASYLASLEIAVTGSIDEHWESTTAQGAVVENGRLVPQDVSVSDRIRGYQSVQRNNTELIINRDTIEPIIIPAGSEMRIMCSYRTYTFRDISKDIPDTDSEFKWNTTVTSVGERRGSTLAAIFKTIVPYKISYDCDPVVMKFYLNENINPETNTVDYSSDSKANLSGKMAWYNRFRGPNSDFDPNYIEVLEWTPYVTFRWAYTDEEGNLLRHYERVSNGSHPNQECYERRAHCVPMILHPNAIGESFYKMVLTRKQVTYYHDEQTLKCNVNYVI